MSESYFFLGDEFRHQDSELIRALRKYSNLNKVQVYVVKKPLGENKYKYEYSGGVVVLVPNHKIMILDLQGENGFEDYHEDFLEDLASISDKYNYKDVVGRSRVWRNEVIFVAKSVINFETFSFKELLSKNKLTSPQLKKKVELLISLVTGSINDIEKVKGDVPDNILDKVKQKILLFDGDQTRFVYDQPSKKKVVIQGLSGTGKTELLLHKLKEIYVGHPNSKIFFTCHNKILAVSLRERIPKFFNFMKVDEQIAWEQRLWCNNAWGSARDKDSGAYRYICDFYGISFATFSYVNTFKKVCREALEKITSEVIADKGYAFNYVLLDESQDFPNEFIELCATVTEKNVYIAGDIFQSIFEESMIDEVSPDYLLSKCYRTDPRTLMFAHGLGMGLFEKEKLRWLSDEEWERCGYILNRIKDNRLIKFTREPLRRFEDLAASNINSIQLIRPDLTPEKGNSLQRVIELIQGLRDENPTITQDDIGIIFLGSNNFGYRLADQLDYMIDAKFGWSVNKAYESKRKAPDSLFISNKNNVKGLEFPFVICVADYLSSSKNERNAIYMMLTRSFIQSFLVIDQPQQKEALDAIEAGLNQINTDGFMQIEEPLDAEKIGLRTKINLKGESLSIFDMLESIFDELDVPPLWRDPISSLVKTKQLKIANYESIKDTVIKAMRVMD